MNEHLPLMLHDGTTVEALAPVIVSASRSTDIPAFYARWFMNRLRAGYCIWYNPFNRRPVYVSFARTKVVVFWTKDPAPLMPYLGELDAMRLKYYFQVTLNDYGREGFEPGVPPLGSRIDTFRRLSGMVGPDRIIWRFDPLVVTPQLSAGELLSRIAGVGDALRGATRRLVFSFVDVRAYRKVQANLVARTPYFSRDTVLAAEPDPRDRDILARGLAALRDRWRGEGWDVTLATCGEEADLGLYGIEHNRCIDGELMERIFGNDRELVYYLRTGRLPERDLFGLLPQMPAARRDLKDRGQRKACGCMVSKDIGMYDTCRHFCVYCYANASREAVERNALLHDDTSESLIRL